MKIDKSCKTRLITDTPSEIDEFGGSHKRVAEAIAELIISEDGGKTIGLEGEWGTGKSTVISLINKLLKSPQNNKEYKLFLFDAWAHESDPLRKIFLWNGTKKVDTFNVLKVKVVQTQQGCDSPKMNAISGDCTKLR